ncbi:MAG: hypothetical protein QOD77_1125 [Thermoplasmata archaeon]|nr:hypothetical protein [Thermoplasmata archaeon]
MNPLDSSPRTTRLRPVAAALLATGLLLVLASAPADAFVVNQTVVVQDDEGDWHACVGYDGGAEVGIEMTEEGILAFLMWPFGGAEYAGAQHHCPTPAPPLLGPMPIGP